MAQRYLGTVRQIWRYPVKSMLGERLQAVGVSARGLYGDRAWALRESASGHLISAKKWPRMLELRASYEIAPADAEDRGVVRIDFPGGSIHAEDPVAPRLLSEFLGVALSVERPGAKRAQIGIDPATVFGDIPASEILPGLAPGTVLPPTFGAAHGTFFDTAAIHLIASATLAHLGALQGSDAADPRRFRPNLLIETGAAAAGFVEDEWIGHTVAIGELRFDKLTPSLRCVMTTLAQADLPRDLSVLRTAARHHRAMVGVTGRVTGHDAVRIGDPVFLFD